MRMKPGRPSGSRGLAHADVHAPGRPGLGQQYALRPVWWAVAQVVQVPDGDVAQTLEAGDLEHVALAAQHAGRGGPGQRAHGPVHLGQQRHVGGRITPRKGVLGAAVVLHQRLAIRPARNQPRHLRAAVAAQVLQVAQHRPLVGATQSPVLEAAQHLLDPAVPPLVVLGPPKLQRLRACHHLAHLLQRAYLRLVHVDHHRFDDQHPAHSSSH